MIDTIKELDYYLIQGKDAQGKTVTKPYYEGIAKPIVLINVYKK